MLFLYSMMADSPENTTEKVSDKMICESCGNDLLCGAKTGSCWCFEVQVDSDKLEDLQKKFNNCLCQNCLTNKIELLLPESTPAKTEI